MKLQVLPSLLCNLGTGQVVGTQLHQHLLSYPSHYQASLEGYFITLASLVHRQLGLHQVSMPNLGSPTETMIENRAFYPWTHCFTRYLAVLWHNFGLLISWGRFCTCPAAERENCFTIRRPSNSKGWIMLCSNRLKNSARVTALMSECLWYVWWLMKETACPSYSMCQEFI